MKKCCEARLDLSEIDCPCLVLTKRATITREIVRSPAKARVIVLSVNFAAGCLLYYRGKQCGCLVLLLYCIIVVLYYCCLVVLLSCSIVVLYYCCLVLLLSCIIVVSVLSGEATMSVQVVAATCILGRPRCIGGILTLSKWTSLNSYFYF